MLGKQRRLQSEFFVACSLGDLVPENYILRRVDAILDLSWFRERVAALYSSKTGRNSIDPESGLRFMLAGFFLGITSDRRLMSEASLHAGIRWFTGYEFHEKLPDHSSLTRLRQRWGPDLFQLVFERVVQQCIKAGLVSKTTVHIDATVIEANCDWAVIASRHAKQVLEENDTCANSASENSDQGPKADPVDLSKKKPERTSSDPDASLTRGGPRGHKMPGYKQHRAVDTKTGVIVDCEVTTGGYNEGNALLDQVDRVSKLLEVTPAQVTADGGYDQPFNYKGLQERGIDALIPPRKKGGRCPKVFGVSRFRYDAKYDLVRCPAGQHLHRRNPDNHEEPQYRADRTKCAKCPLRSQCLSPSQSSRQVQIVPDFPHLLRARRRKLRKDPEDIALYKRHRWRVEGSHGEAKTQHVLRRAQRRGLPNIRIQSYLSSTVMNLKRLAGSISDLVSTIFALLELIWAIHTPSAKRAKLIHISSC